MEKQEIIEFKSTLKRKHKAKNRANKLRLATEITLDKIKILPYHGADIELMNNVWKLAKRYAS